LTRAGTTSIMNEPVALLSSSPPMRRLIRPSLLVWIAIGLALVAGGLLFWPAEAAVGARAVPRPVPPGDQEVVWLNAATNASWERFVAAVQRLKSDRPDLALEILTSANPFPDQTTMVPELAVRARGSAGTLWFRWYKLTGDLGAREWVSALAARQPAPLAIIGGGSSDRARDLARELEAQQARFASAPLLLITSATAVHVGSEQELLMGIYPGRSFRFCFTDRQMAQAVADFIWSQDDLRPDSAPFYMAQWTDDPYSADLFDQFHEVLGPEGFARLFERALARMARDWGWLAGRTAVGGVPPGLDFEGLRQSEAEPPAPSPFLSTLIPYSVGPFNEANPYEVLAAQRIVSELDQHPGQHRPLLVLPAWPQPARRFLRALLRTAPVDAGRFVVATGDAVDFNTVYRDRDLLWPIQDLPLRLVFFCHRNPADAQAFDPHAEAGEPGPGGPTATGSHDLLLYRDIVEATMESAYAGGNLCESANALLMALQGQRQDRFDANGDQRSGTGEYVVCLRPMIQDERVLAEAKLSVWNWQTGAGGGRKWARVSVAGGPELDVRYMSAADDAGTRR
jgi:hypothetical protein